MKREITVYFVDGTQKMFSSIEGVSFEGDLIHLSRNLMEGCSRHYNNNIFINLSNILYFENQVKPSEEDIEELKKIELACENNNKKDDRISTEVI